MNEKDVARQMMMACAICGESRDIDLTVSLLTVRDPSGRTGIFVAHSLCVIGVFHPNARALLDAAPVARDPG